MGESPVDIGVNQLTGTIYVVNIGNGTVSVINGTTNTKIGKDIPVGDGRYRLGISYLTDKVYVPNLGDNTVSVINGKTNTKIGKDIPVGKGPIAIGVNTNTNTVYVVNSHDSVSVMDGKSNKVVAGVMFNVEPFNSGHIECDKDKLIAPLSRQFYVYSGAECVAKPNQGFEFVSWEKNLKGNSTQFLQVAPAPYIFDSILDLFHMKPDKPEATLNITKFGALLQTSKLYHHLFQQNILPLYLL